MRKILFLLLFSPFAAYAATYYVSTSGSDSNSGSQASPWKTISKAAGVAKAGDVVNVGSGSFGEAVRISASGTAASRITFNGASGARTANVTIDGAYVTFTGFALSNPQFDAQINGDYAIVSNCDCTGTVGSSAAITIGDIGGQITGCKIHDLVDADAMHVWGHDLLIANNEIYGNSNPDVAHFHADFIQTWGFSGANSYNVIIENNYQHDCKTQIGNTETDGSPGLHSWTFRNNIFANVESAFFSGIPKTLFYNNLFYYCGTVQNCPVFFYGDTRPGNERSSAGSEVINNSFYVCGNAPQNAWIGGIGSSGWDLTQNKVEKNHFAGTNNAAKDGRPGQAYLGSNPINGGDPKFKNAGGKDYHITSGSVLANAGATISSFNVDKDGVRRPQGTAWCVGPYELVSGGGGPTPTPAPTVTPSPTATPAPSPPKFAVGQSVTPTGTCNVRATPSGAVLGTHDPSETGVVISGPQNVDLNGEAVVWWQIDFVSAPDGWVGEDMLEIATGPTPTPTPTPGPSPTPNPSPSPSGCVSFTGWDSSLHAELANCPTVAELSAWLSAHPPVADPASVKGADRKGHNTGPIGALIR